MVWFIIGLVVGLFAGAFGVLGIALCVAAKGKKVG